MDEKAAEIIAALERKYLGVPKPKPGCWCSKCGELRAAAREKQQPKRAAAQARSKAAEV
jgi:hypothetical protein